MQLPQANFSLKLQQESNQQKLNNRQFQTYKMHLQTDCNPLPLKLNCSSIASSTPGNNISFPEGELVKFQQFNKQQNPKSDRPSLGHKKKLTIQINDSYDFNPSSVDHSQYNIGVESVTTDKDEGDRYFFKKHQKQKEQDIFAIEQSLSPSFANSNTQIQINKILSYNMFLQEKIKALEHQNSDLKVHLGDQNMQMNNLNDQNQHMKCSLKKKQDQFICEKQKNGKLSEKIAELQEEKVQHKFYDQKLRQKQVKMQQLQRKLQKITVMNRAFQKQLKESDKKILELQKDLQKAFCQNQHQTLNRIKQSSVKVKQAPVKSKQLISNKQNLNHNAMGNSNVHKANNLLGSTIQMRKSIQKKKGSQSQGKKKQQTGTIRGQRTSSSSNLVTKKLLLTKKQ